MKTIMAQFTLILVCLLAITLILPGVSTGAVDPDSAVGVWLFDDSSSEIAIDSSGNGHDGTFTGDPNWAPGKFGMALDLDGFGDIVEIPRFGEALPSEEVTIMAWVKLKGVKNQDLICLMPLNSISPAGSRLIDRCAIHFPWNRPIYNAIHWQYGWNQVTVDRPLDSVGKWEHWAFTYSIPSKFMKIYRNGSEIASTSEASRYTPRNGDLQIGGRLDSSFDGLIDEFAVFNVALSENDIRTLMGGINRAFARNVSVGKTVVSPDADSIPITVFARLPGENIHKFSFDIAFEPSILQAIDIAEGTFLNQDGAATIWNAPVINNDDGLITGITCRRSGVEGLVKSTGPLVVVTFKPVTAGGSAVSLQNLRLSTPDDTGIPVEARVGWVDVFAHGSISGEVKDAENQTPIANAKIEVRRGGYSFGLETSSDESGMYIVEGVPVGEFEVIASKYPYARAGAKTLVRSGETTSNINFEMKPILSLGEQDTQK